MSKRLILVPLAAAGIAFNASAAQQTTTFQVTATVVGSCTVSAGNLAFSNYDPQSLVPEIGVATVTVTCATGTPFSVGLNQGAHGASVSARQMASGANRLNYVLTRDPVGLLNWGNTPLTDTLDSLGLGIAQPFTVFGSIPTGQAVPTGSYSDTITVTITY